MKVNVKVIKTNLNKLVKSIVGSIFQRKISRAWNFSHEQFFNYQKKELLHTLDYARKHTEFYKRNEYKNIEFDENWDLKEMLNEVPLLKKSVLKANNNDFWANNLINIRTFHTTSGTSGTPLKIPGTLFERSFTNQNLKQWYKYLNGKKTQRILGLSGFMVPEGEEIYWVDPISKNAFLSIYDINNKHRDTIINLLNDIKPTIIYGYASALNQLADIVVDSNLLELNMKVISTSEVLADDYRANIQNHVGEVYNLYGSQEGAHMAIECKGNNLHINPLVGIVEILDENNRHVKDGELGRVVVTSLFKKSMPLIRYEIGDMAYGVDEYKKCTCGLEWPMMGSVQGRKEDLVVKRDGSKIPLLSFHALKDVEIVSEGQLIQHNYEEFDFNLVLRKRATQEEVESLEDHIYSQMTSRLNIEKLVINFNYVENIEKGPNGKFKSVEVRF